MYKLLILAVSVLFWGVSSAQDLQLKTINNKSLPEISGLAKMADKLVLLPQREMALYVMSLDDVLSAMENEKKAAIVQRVPITGDSPDFKKGSGWEAIAIDSKADPVKVFLSHEDNNGSHSIYEATITSSMHPFADIQIRQRVKLTPVKDDGFAYESLVVEEKKLIAIPELSVDKINEVLIASDSHVNEIPLLSSTRYRLSAAKMLPKTDSNIIATSFCYTGDFSKGKCDLKDKNTSEGHLVCLKRKQNLIEAMDKIKLPLKVDGVNDKAEYNVEGIVFFKEGILLINDNNPGKAVTTLRYLADKKTQDFIKRCTEFYQP